MRWQTIPILCFTAVVHFSPVGAAGASADGHRALAAVTVSDAREDQHGILVHTVQSPYQAGKTTVRVLLPDGLEEAAPCPVLFVLPVEAKDGKRYGDGLLEVRRHDLHNQHRLVCVQPTFSHLPWYADHPVDPEIRQETYFLEVVLPLVEERYPVRREAGGRLLLGFSKSGWGAFAMLLRHPGVFGRAAAWDAPLDMQRPDRYGMAGIFGSQESFAQYQISELLKRRAGELHNAKRLVLMGYDNFRSHHHATRTLMIDLRIPHVYRDGPRRKHAWGSGWVGEAVRLLVDQK